MGGVFALGFLALGSGKGRLVEEAVGVNNVVVDAALRNFLGLELGFGREVAPVVVAEVVVGEDGQKLDTGVDRELSKDRLETVAPDKRTFVCRLKCTM